MAQNAKCLQCGNPLTDDQVRHGVEYHQVCYGQSPTRKKRTVAKKPWSRFLAHKRIELDISQNALARLIGLSNAAISRQLAGADPSEKLLSRARTMFPGEVPDDVGTREARSRENARRQLAAIHAKPREMRIEWGTKGGKAGEGKPKPGQSEPMRAWHVSSAGQEHRKRLVEVDGPRLTSVVTSTKGRIVLELTTYLRDHPELRKQPDALDVIRARAQLVAERGDHGLPASAVWEVWKPYLKKKRYPVGAGRPARDWPAVDRRKRELEESGERVVWPVLGPEFGATPESLARGFRRWQSRQEAVPA